eukprot:1015153-Pleurochrysis_carterae.AAC.1
MQSSDTTCNNNTRHTDYGRRFQGPGRRSTIYTREANKRGNVGRGDETPSTGNALKGQYCDMG